MLQIPVCPTTCTQKTVIDPNFPLDSSVGYKDVKIGDLSSLHHGVSGEVFVRDEKTLVIKNFNYDGTAPDAFFVVGSAGTPTTFQDNNAAILAHPFEGIHYDYTNSDAPVLAAAANEDVILSLPPSMQVLKFLLHIFFQYLHFVCVGQ